MAGGYTIADLEAVRRARAQGTLSVKTGTDQVTYRSDQELAAAERAILADLARQEAEAGASKPRQIYPYQRSRGY